MLLFQYCVKVASLWRMQDASEFCIQAMSGHRQVNFRDSEQKIIQSQKIAFLLLSKSKTMASSSPPLQHFLQCLGTHKYLLN